MTVDDTIIVRSRRGRLVAQAVGLAVLGLLAGITLQSWSFVRSSPLGRVSDSTGLPVIAIVLSVLAVWIGGTLARDSWNHQVELGREGLAVQDLHGRFSVAYDDVASVRAVALGGVAIAFHDPEKWLASLASGRDIRRRTSLVVRQAHGADILLSAKELDVGPTVFVELLNGRLERQK